MRIFGHFELAVRRPRRQTTQDGVRPLDVVVGPACFDPLPPIGRGKELAGVKAVGADSRVERFGKGIIYGRAGAGEAQLETVRIRPLVERAAGNSRS